jgi:hypothetical protein
MFKHDCDSCQPLGEYEYLSALQRQLRDGYNDTASGLIATSRNTLKGMK